MNNKCLVSSCDKIKKSLGYCRLHYARFKRRGTSIGLDIKLQRKYFFDESIFNNIDDKLSYLLGWITTDGNIKKGTIELTITDKDILEKLRDLICVNLPIKLRKRSGTNVKPIYSLVVCSKKMVKDIIDLGITEKKSLTIDFPNIPDKYFYHFLRGCIEGDGCIFLRRKKNHYDFCVSFYSASLKLISAIKQKTGHKTKIKITNQGKNPMYCLSWYGINAIELCDLIYKESGDLKLNRKYYKYLEYKKYLIGTGRLSS